MYHGPSAFSEAETRNVKWLLDAFPRTRWFIGVHSFPEDILYLWGDDESQSATPSMNLLNPAHNGQRGRMGDACKEFIQADDLAVVQSLSSRRQGMLAARTGRATETASL